MSGKKLGKIKCVVWDLDNTLWDGVLLEDESVYLRQKVIDIIDTFDQRGILQSIASKNHYDDAMRKLKEFKIDHYFLFPQINWGSKAISISNIAQAINIGIDTIAFIDDQPFERDEVSFSHPEVTCLDAMNWKDLISMEEFMPRFITEDSRIRRSMYQNDILRRKEEEKFDGPHEEFLASLNLTIRISKVNKDDLQRAEELTIRTHQLNTTGYTYSYEELKALSESRDHRLWIADLEDKYGTYGKIGLALVSCHDDLWNIKLLLMSCRVMSRGVGSILLNHIMHQAKAANARLQAEFVSNDRNRTMFVTYKFAGFREVSKDSGHYLLENDLTSVQPFPNYVTVLIANEDTCRELLN